MSKLKSRDSGIELLKIFAMIIIVSSHVIQTLSYQRINGDLVFDLTLAGQGITNSIIAALQYNGAIGNFIFFSCSAWFLVDSEKANKRKILLMILDVWIISVVILIITYIFKHGSIGLIEIIRNIFPITYQNNWYITCYILFYAIHPLLNQVINGMNKQQHFRVVFAMVVIYYFWGFVASVVREASFYGNVLVMWMVLYFVIAYMKRYMPKLCCNVKMNILLLAIALLGNYGLIFGTNILKMASGVFADKMQFWNKGNNPFIILLSISLVNIAKEVKWKNRAVNYIASLTLYIYIIHENWFIRCYLRPDLWQKIYENFGYTHVFTWIIIMTAAIFICSVLLSIVYERTLHKLIVKISDRAYISLVKIYNKIEQQLVRLN